MDPHSSNLVKQARADQVRAETGVDAGEEAEMILNMDDEEADEMELGPAYVQKLIDYTNQRGIIVGHEVPEPWNYKFSDGLSDKQVELVLSYNKFN
jgi:hypothetical protein